MSESSFPLDSYLKRIRFSGPLLPTQETLRHLHRAQVQQIPFENLDIFLGQPIRLDTASLVTKLVDASRGGYCYELNGLFWLALHHLGFMVTPLAARVLRGDVPAQKSHRLTLVTFGDERWIADVGFGGNGLIEALPLEADTVFDQHLDTFRIVTDPRLGFILQHQLGDAWRGLYAFTLEEYYPADYEMMNYFNSTSPTSIFTRQPLCILATPEARLILEDHKLTIRRPGEIVTRHIEDDLAYREALQRFFGITLPSDAMLSAPTFPATPFQP